MDMWKAPMVQSGQPVTYRPKILWKQLRESDCRESKLSAMDPYDRRIWRSGVRSDMRAASQLPGRRPTDVDVAPVPAH